MKKLWGRFIELFTKSFQIFEESNQINQIKSVGKNENGYTTIEVKPVGTKNSYLLFPHQIMSQELLKKQFLPEDIKLTKTLLIAEGDIFVESKEYTRNNELYFLKSLLNQEKWILTRSEIKEQKNIYCRINIRFFDKSLSKKLLG